MSKFSTYPHDHHFVVLRKVAKCLRGTKDWGIIYRRSQPDTSLLPSNFIRSSLDADLPAFPNVDPNKPVALHDAAHVNDLRNRRSTTGYAFLLCGGAMSYRCKTQSMASTSSTKAEFLAAVATAKHA